MTLEQIVLKAALSSGTTVPTIEEETESPTFISHTVTSFLLSWSTSSKSLPSLKGRGTDPTSEWGRSWCGHWRIPSASNSEKQQPPRFLSINSGSIFCQFTKLLKKKISFHSCYNAKWKLIAWKSHITSLIPKNFTCCRARDNILKWTFLLSKK